MNKRGFNLRKLDLARCEIVRVKGNGGKTKLRELGLEYGVWGIESNFKFVFYKQE